MTYNKNSKSKIRKQQKNSAYTHDIAVGCKHCEAGAKMVLLITGLCTHKCFYCPLSEKKMGRDVVYANERLVKSDDDEYDAHDTARDAQIDGLIIDEAEKIDAEGTGITGGDPLAVLDRTVHAIKLLKKHFGANHHIHLYTATSPSKQEIERLAQAGLDEIRFHPEPELWAEIGKTEYAHSIKSALLAGLDAGVEIPAIPASGKDIVSLAKYLDGTGASFLNLNELEFSETNSDALIKRGYETKDELSASVAGSEKTAYSVINESLEERLSLPIHYCSSSYKDAVQLKNRLGRRAKNVAHKYDVLTEENTLVRGIIEIGAAGLKDKKEARRMLAGARAKLAQEFRLQKSLIGIDEEKSRIEIAPWILEKIAPKLDKAWRCFIVEEYPTADRLEVERTPL